MSQSNTSGYSFSALDILFTVWRTLFAIAGVAFAVKFLMTVFDFKNGLSELNFADILFFMGFFLLLRWQWKTAKRVGIHWYTVLSRIFGYFGFLTLILLFLFAEYSHFIYSPIMRLLTLAIYLGVMALLILPLKWKERSRSSVSSQA